MPKKPTLADLMAQIKDCCELIATKDQLVVGLAKRLDALEARLAAHVKASTAVHQDIRGAVATLRHRVDDLTRQRP